MVPGLGTAAKMGGQMKHIGYVAGLNMGLIEDDGKPKSCWKKNEVRLIVTATKPILNPRTNKRECLAGKVLSMGTCYDPCHEGTQYGPVCWGECPKHTTPCG